MRQANRYTLSGSAVTLLVVDTLILCSGCTAQSFSVSQQLIDFGDVAVGGDSNILPVVLYNGGDAANVIGVSIQARTGSPDGQFTITGGSCTTLTAPLGTTDSCAYTVQAKPTVSGTVSAIMIVTGSNPADGTFTSQPAILTVNGVTPKLAMYPALDFGDVVVGTSSPPQDFTLANVGTVPASIDGASLSIASDNPQFIPIGSSCSNTLTLGPGETCTITVRAIPSIPGMTTQQCLLQGGPGSAYAPVSNPLTVNGVLPTLPLSPALNPGPTPSSPVHKSSPPPPPPHHHHSGKL